MLKLDTPFSDLQTKIDVFRDTLSGELLQTKNQILTRQNDFFVVDVPHMTEPGVYVGMISSV